MYRITGDESGLQFINFDFVTGGQEIIFFILVQFWVFSHYFVFFSSFFFAFIAFSDFISVFQDNKVSL